MMSSSLLQRQFISTIGLALIACIINIACADALINKLDDIEAHVTPGRLSDLQMTEHLCVGINPSGPLSLLLLGSGSKGAFSIQNGPDSIPYSVSISGRVSNGRFRSVISGVPLTGLQSRVLSPSNRCRGNTTILRVIFKSNAFSSAHAGIYRGSLQITVIPE